MINIEMSIMQEIRKKEQYNKIQIMEALNIKFTDEEVGITSTYPARVRYVLIPETIRHKKELTSELKYDIIERCVCQYYNVSVIDLMEKNRKREVVEARQIIYYFIKSPDEKSSVSDRLEWIGGRYGQDHASVLHGVKTIANYISKYKTWKDKCNIMRNKILQEFQDVDLDYENIVIINTEK